MIKDKKITIWQAGIMLFMLMFANKILVLPSLLSEEVKMEAFFVPIVAFLVDIMLLCIFIYLKKRFPNEKLFDVIKKRFGKAVTIIVYIGFAMYFFMKTVLLYNVTYMFLRNLIYRDSGNMLFLISVLPVVNFLAFVDLRALGRTIQLFFPIVVFGIVFCVIIGFFGINGNLLLFQSSLPQILTSAAKNIGCFGDTIFLFLIMDKIEMKKGQAKILFSLQIGAIILVDLVHFVFILSYTYTTFLHPFAIFELMSFVKEYEGLGRIDVISVILIVIMMYFLLAIYLKAILCCTGDIFPSVNPNCFIVLYDVIVGIFAVAIFFTLGRVILFGKMLLPYVGVVSLIVVPLISIISLVDRKKEKKDEKLSN